MPYASEYPTKLAHITATIASGQTTSGEIDLAGCVLCGLYLPGTLTGTSMKFQVSDATGGTYRTIADGAGSDVSKTVAASKYIPLDPADFAGVRFLKLVSGSAEGADRSILLAVRPV